MLALIAHNENDRICQVQETEFPVAPPLEWVACPDECTTEWTYVDGTFEPPVPPPVYIPSVVSMRQARLALYQQGLLSQVQTTIDSMPEPNKTVAQITWDYATEVNKSDPLVAALSMELGLDSATLDALFTLASTL